MLASLRTRACALTRLEIAEESRKEKRSQQICGDASHVLRLFDVDLRNSSPGTLARVRVGTIEDIVATVYERRLEME